MSFDRGSTAKFHTLFQWFTTLSIKKVHVLNHFVMFQLPTIAAWCSFLHDDENVVVCFFWFSSKEIYIIIAG